MSEAKKISQKVKTQIAREVGRQVRKLIRQKIESSDPKAVSYAGKYAEDKALALIDRDAASAAKSQKSGKFKIKIEGVAGAVKDARVARKKNL